jgi:hypothetical protein
MAGALAAAHAVGGKTGLNCVDFIVRSCSTKNVNWLFCFAAPSNRDRRVRGFGLRASRPSRNAPQQNRERILPFAYGGRRMGFLRKIARFRLARSVDRPVLFRPVLFPSVRSVRSGNTTLQVGPDGALLVDTQYAPLASNIMAEVRKLTPRPF